MKITAVLVTMVDGSLVIFFFPFAPLIVFATFVLYLAFGILRSINGGLDPLNDAPNAFRVLLAASAPLLAFALPQPFGFSSALLSFLAALLLNDEYQRRAVDSVRKRRVGGAVALLGIDGSGKSTHAEQLEGWFRERGYYCTRVPFHRYLFVERLRRKRPAQPSGLRGGGNPLRPILSAIDNILLYLMTSFGRGLEGRVVLYDRYIWSTYVKYEALGYPVKPLRWLYMLPRPRYAVVLDVGVAKSLAVIGSRPQHIRYRGDVLSLERAEYAKIARETGFPLVDASRDKAAVQTDIETMLSAVFPSRGR